MTTGNRLKVHTSSYGIYIDSPPYKSLKYALLFVLYFTFVGLFILCVIYWNEIFYKNKFTGIIKPYLIGLLGISMFIFAINKLPLFFSVIKNSFYRNFFLKENLTVDNEKIVYVNSLGKRISLKLCQIKCIYFEFNKPYGKFSGVPELIPNYTPTIYLKDQNYNILAKIMYSINEKEIQIVYKIILNYILNEKHFYKERDVDYTDKIKDIHHWGKEIEFIPAQEFFKIHKDKFSNEEYSDYYKLLEQHDTSEQELSEALLLKIKDIHSN